jgi:pimeloyl-ACP methyl ester carboxylesterase
MDGEAARNSPDDDPIYSFAVIDRFLQILDNPSIFCNLKKITVTGHSAGGQFTQRYTAANQMEPKIAAPIKYVIANPSSYMYLNDLRLERGATCSERGGCTGDFVYYWDRQNCPDYNDYKYGMDNRTGYIALVSAAAIREQFTTRAVTYLLGERDTSREGVIDLRCPAEAQGSQRRERGTIFWNYIRRHYGANHDFYIVPGCGHLESCMYASDEAISAVLF